MPRPSPRIAVVLAIALLGAHAQIVQAWLIRESLVVFYGNEVSLGAFFGSWLLWFAAGSALVLRLRGRSWVRDARAGLAGILLLLPPLLLLQVAMLRGVRLLLDIPSVELVPLGDLFLALLLITLPSALALGLGFPLACKALRDLVADPGGGGGTVRDVSRIYIFESLGAFLGGVLFTFVLIQWSGMWRSLGLLALALALAAALLGGGRRLRIAAWLLGLAGLVLALTPLAGELQQRLERLRFATLQPGLELLEALDTRYGHLAIGRLGPQVSLVRDGHIAESFPLPRETEQAAAYLYTQAAGAERVLMFGGVAGGLAAELLRYPLQRLEVVEQDRRAFARVRGYLPVESRAALDDSRLALHFLDGRRFLNRLAGSGGYDLVLVLDAVPTSAHSNRYFTREFYAQVRANLAPRGVFCTRVSSASNYLGRSVRSYTGSIYRTLKSVFPQVAIMPGDTQLYCASAAPDRVTESASELERRYLDIPLEERRFPALSFYSLLPVKRIAYVREQLEADRGALNSDERPVTYYLNMVLWGQFSASGFVDWLERLRRMGPWPYLIPVGVFVLLWLLRVSLEGFQRPRLQRQAASYALAVLGLVAMAAQLLILFGYQAHVGFMFERVALLNALFMTGLALGAGALGQRLARGRRSGGLLALLLALTALALPGLPSLLAHLAGYPVPLQEAAYLALSALVGLLTGTGYPLGVRQAHDDLGEVAATSGIAEAADSLGGALGGLLTGALLVPLLGVQGTGRLLALLCLSALLPLLYARWMPLRLPALRLRGGRAFPWALPGWGLALVVLTLYGWQLVERGTAPGPRLQFEEQQLTQVSGSKTFRQEPVPFVHYIGWDEGNSELAPPDSASLSSMAVAAEVRGYAGSLNLLVALDREGRLRGVRYVDSHETPSYIVGIRDWLAGLAGKDLAREPLDLTRVDALSGATVSSRAALEAVNRSVRAAGEQVFQREFAPREGARTATGLGSVRFLATLVLLLLFFPVYLSGSERGRLVLQGASLVILGFWLNSLVTEVDLVNLSLGQWASPADNPQRWLLLGFVLATTLLFGQVWCGYLCPFGALQELLSRLGRRLGLRSYPQRSLENRARFLKFVLLALMLGAVWLTDEVVWATFNPMQHAFGGRWDDWMAVLLTVILSAALVYVRFWCRYLCPFGAFLALGNKIALLQRLAPQRRFEHCDLGVKETFDLDCIRCNRCLTGRDTHKRVRG